MAARNEGSDFMTSCRMSGSAFEPAPHPLNTAIHRAAAAERCTISRIMEEFLRVETSGDRRRPRFDVWHGLIFRTDRVLSHQSPGCKVEID